MSVRHKESAGTAHAATTTPSPEVRARSLAHSHNGRRRRQPVQDDGRHGPVEPHIDKRRGDLAKAFRSAVSPITPQNPRSHHARQDVGGYAKTTRPLSLAGDAGVANQDSQPQAKGETNQGRRGEGGRGECDRGDGCERGGAKGGGRGKRARAEKERDGMDSILFDDHPAEAAKQAGTPKTRSVQRRAFGSWSRLAKGERRVSVVLRLRCQHFLKANIMRMPLVDDRGSPDLSTDPWSCCTKPSTIRGAAACEGETLDEKKKDDTGEGDDDDDGDEKQRATGSKRLDNHSAAAEYAREIEEAIYRKSVQSVPAKQRCQRYKRDVCRIAYAILVAGAALRDAYDVERLVSLDDERIGMHTPHGRASRRAQQCLDGCRALMADTDLFDETLAPIARCRKCGADAIVYNTIQTRGMDEPTTVYYRCTRTTCNEHWHI
jgi:DNA-directed RNA polymerase subunit M/transcription elongation factor TFIIS